MYLTGHFDPNSPTGCTLSGQKCSNMGCLTLTDYSTSCFLSNRADLCSPQANHRIMKCDCIVFSRVCFVREVEKCNLFSLSF